MQLSSSTPNRRKVIPTLTTEQRDAVIEKLGADIALRFLQNELVIHTKAPRFLKITTVTTGVIESAEEACRLISHNRGCVSQAAKFIIEQMPYETTHQELELFLVTADNLGLTKEATREEVYEKAQEFGFLLCPAEVVVELWQNYLSKGPRYTKYTHYTLAMEPVLDANGELSTFHMDHSSCVHPATLFPQSRAYGGEHWVFARKK